MYACTKHRDRMLVGCSVGDICCYHVRTAGLFDFRQSACDTVIHVDWGFVLSGLGQCARASW